MGTSTSSAYASSVRRDVTYSTRTARTAIRPLLAALLVAALSVGVALMLAGGPSVAGASVASTGPDFPANCIAIGTSTEVAHTTCPTDDVETSYNTIEYAGRPWTGKTVCVPERDNAAETIGPLLNAVMMKMHGDNNTTITPTIQQQIRLNTWGYQLVSRRITHDCHIGGRHDG